MTHQERKAKNPDYQICALKDSAFKGLAKNNKKFFEKLAANLIGIDYRTLKGSLFVDTELNGTNKDDKIMVADLVLCIPNVLVINFEANTYESNSLDLKNTYYTYKLTLHYQEPGETYKNINIYQINFDLKHLKFNKNIINRFVTIDPVTHEELPGTPKIIHVDLENYKKNPYNEDISDWLKRAFGLFLSTSIEDSKKLAGNDQDLKGVADFMKQFSSNIDNLKYLDEQEALMKAFRTDAKIAEEKAAKAGLEKGEQIGLEKGEQIGLEKGEQIGLEKGEKNGEKKKAIEIAKNAIDHGLKNEDISKITGLSVKEIENLR